MKVSHLDYEKDLHKQGFLAIAGVDEVGRGCWAGPVVTAAVILPVEYISNTLEATHWTNTIRDSKLLSKKNREEVGEFIREHTLWAIGESTNEEIDSLGISQATRLAMTRTLGQLDPDYVLIDGRDKLNIMTPQQAIVDGDALSVTIAAASIIAKVYRDKLMEQLNEQYPNYGFVDHVGYGTKKHIEALKTYGPCAIHRFSYKPIKKFVNI